MSTVKTAVPFSEAKEVVPSSPLSVTLKSPSSALATGITKTDAIIAKVAKITPKVFMFCSIISPFLRSTYP